MAEQRDLLVHLKTVVSGLNDLQTLDSTYTKVRSAASEPLQQDIRFLVKGTQELREAVTLLHSLGKISDEPARKLTTTIEGLISAANRGSTAALTMKSAFESVLGEIAGMMTRTSNEFNRLNAEAETLQRRALSPGVSRATYKDSIGPLRREVFALKQLAAYAKEVASDVEDAAAIWAGARDDFGRMLSAPTARSVFGADTSSRRGKDSAAQLVINRELNQAIEKLDVARTEMRQLAAAEQAATQQAAAMEQGLRAVGAAASDDSARVKELTARITELTNLLSSESSQTKQLEAQIAALNEERANSANMTRAEAEAIERELVDLRLLGAELERLKRLGLGAGPGLGAGLGPGLGAGLGPGQGRGLGPGSGVFTGTGPIGTGPMGSPLALGAGVGLALAVSKGPSALNDFIKAVQEAAWYVEKTVGKKHYVWGPFASQAAAAEAAFLNRSVEDRDSHTNKRSALYRGVSQYGADELKSAASDPGGFGWTSFTVNPAGKIPVHESWRKLGREFGFKGLDFARDQFRRDARLPDPADMPKLTSGTQTTTEFVRDVVLAIPAIKQLGAGAQQAATNVTRLARAIALQDVKTSYNRPAQTSATAAKIRAGVAALDAAKAGDAEYGNLLGTAARNWTRTKKETQRHFALRVADGLDEARGRQPASALLDPATTRGPSALNQFVPALVQAVPAVKQLAAASTEAATVISDLAKMISVGSGARMRELGRSMPALPKSRKAADFESTGTWEFDYLGKTQGIFRDRDSKWWYDADIKRAEKGLPPGIPAFPLSMENKKEAMQKLMAQLSKELPQITTGGLAGRGMSLGGSTERAARALEELAVASQNLVRTWMTLSGLMSPGHPWGRLLNAPAAQGLLSRRQSFPMLSAVASPWQTGIPRRASGVASMWGPWSPYEGGPFAYDVGFKSGQSTVVPASSKNEAMRRALARFPGEDIGSRQFVQRYSTEMSQEVIDAIRRNQFGTQGFTVGPKPWEPTPMPLQLPSSTKGGFLWGWEQRWGQADLNRQRAARLNAVSFNQHEVLDLGRDLGSAGGRISMGAANAAAGANAGAQAAQAQASAGVAQHHALQAQTAYQRAVSALQAAGYNVGGGGARGGAPPIPPGGATPATPNTPQGRPRNMAQMTIPQMLGFRFQTLAVFALIATPIFAVVNALRQATREGIEFEKIMADIQGVLPSKSVMDRLRIESSVIDSAKRYGASLLEAANAAKFFAQAGFISPQQIAGAMDATIKATRGAGLSVENAEELILSLHAITAGEVEALEILDRISRVEARRAVTATDLFAAITRVGPIAHQLKGDMAGLEDEFDNVMAATTAIVERTRVTGLQAATTVRFIMARLGSPEIVSKLQEIGGVQLAREGGKELRPFAEILFDIAKAYERLTASGNSAKALQLLVALGGARQLSGTTALIQGFSNSAVDAKNSVLDMTRESSLAFGDMAQRTDIAMRTLSAALKQVWAQLADFGQAFLNNKLVAAGFLGIIKTLQGALWTLGGVFKGIDIGLTKIGEGFGYNPWSPKLVGRKDINESVQYKDFKEMAHDNGVTPRMLFRRLQSVGLEAGTELETFFGKPLKEVLKGLDKGSFLGKNEKQVRALHNAYGEKLAGALEDIIPKLAELRAEMEASNDPAEKAAKNAERIALAYQSVSKAGFLGGAIMNANNQRLLDSWDAVESKIQDVFSKVSQGLLNTRKYSPTGAASFGAGNYLNREILDTFFRAFPEKFRGLAKAFFDESSSLWAAAHVEAGKQGITTLGGVLDIYADKLKGLSPGGPIEAGFEKRLRPHIESIVRSDRTDEYLLEGDEVAGRKAMDEMLARSRKVLTQILEERGGPQAAGNTKLVETIRTLNHPMASTAAMLADTAAMTKRFSDILAELILNFYKAEKATEAFDPVLRNVGIGFDTLKARADSAGELLKGLLTFDANVTIRIVQLSKQLQNVSEISTITSFATMPSSAEYMMDDNARSLPGITPQSMKEVQSERIRNARLQLGMQIGYLREEAKRFASDGGIGLTEVLGTSPESLQVIGEFVDAMDLVKDFKMPKDGILSPEQIALLNQATIARDKLLGQVQEVTTTRNLDVDRLERQKNQLEHITELEKLRSQFQIQMLSSSESVAQKLAAEIQMEKLQIQFKREALLLDGSKDKITLAREWDDLDAAERRMEIEKRLLAVAEAHNKLQQQTRANIEQMASGIKSVFTDIEGVAAGNSRQMFTRIFKPMRDTLFTRMTEDTFRTMLDPNNPGLLGRLAKRVGESPERRLLSDYRTTLQMAGDQFSRNMVTAGITVGDEFRFAGMDVATMLSTAMKGGTPTLPDEFVQNADKTWSRKSSASGARGGWMGGPGMNLTPLEKGANAGGRGGVLGYLDRHSWDDQLAMTLSTYLFSGRGQNAGIGAGIGSMIGQDVGKDLAKDLFKEGAKGIGATVGSAALPVVGTLVGAWLGSLVGGLFGGDEEQQKQTQALDRIDQNTRDTATILELERRMLEVARGAINVPAGFTLPQYVPANGVTVQRMDFTIQINEANNPKEVVNTLRAELGPMMRQEFARIGIR
jgi:hypothetical protein